MNADCGKRISERPAEDDRSVQELAAAAANHLTIVALMSELGCPVETPTMPGFAEGWRSAGEWLGQNASTSDLQTATERVQAIYGGAGPLPAQAAPISTQTRFFLRGDNGLELTIVTPAGASGPTLELQFRLAGCALRILVPDAADRERKLAEFIAQLRGPRVGGQVYLRVNQAPARLEGASDEGGARTDGRA